SNAETDGRRRSCANSAGFRRGCRLQSTKASKAFRSGSVASGRPPSWFGGSPRRLTHLPRQFCVHGRTAGAQFHLEQEPCPSTVKSSTSRSRSSRIFGSCFCIPRQDSRDTGCDRGYRWYCRQYCRLLVVLMGGTGGTTMKDCRSAWTALG